ncbi:hypothetical protein U1Q18_018945 [Sarracenia purpurea var. burkii]
MATHGGIRVQTLCIILLLLQHSLVLIAASRQPIFDRIRLLHSPTRPRFMTFTINRYKKTETEAFRPTTPGHSPGVGHQDPPGSA